MNILHLLSNRKWTERAEPAVDAALAQQKLGESVSFVCDQSSGDPEDSCFGQAQRKGLKNVLQQGLPKHLRLTSVFRDIGRLRALISRTAPDIIHCHMPNAHLLAGLARVGNIGPRIVRSCYDPEGPETGLRSRWMYDRYTDGLIVINEESSRAAISRLKFPARKVEVVEPGVDLDRFDPARKVQGTREDFGLRAENFVMGVVSRIRGSRRLDIPLGVFGELSQKFPQVRLVVAGRGKEGAVREVLEEPASELGVSDKLVMAGYCRDDRLVALYRAMDVLLYPVPGTDKSCRTVREAMAAGVPVVASDSGFSGELVEDGKTGRLVSLSVGSFAGAIREMLEDSEMTAAMGRNSRTTAEARFSTDLQAKKLLAFYSHILKNGEINDG